MGITEWITFIILVIRALRFKKILIYIKSMTSNLKTFIVGFFNKNNTHNKKWYKFIWNWVVIINILCVISLLLTVNSTATKSSSAPKYNNESKAVLKCPNCGSESLKSLEPGGRILECNSCGVGFDKSSSSPTYNNENSSSSSEKKCPNCGSTSGSHPHETIPDLKICNTCEVGY